MLFKYANIIKADIDDSATYLDLIDKYNIDQNDFMSWLDSLNVEYEKKEITMDGDWEFISNRIKAEMANAKWGKEFRYKVLINADIQVKEAIKQFEFAERLIKK